MARTESFVCQIRVRSIGWASSEEKVLRLASRPMVVSANRELCLPDSCPLHRLGEQRRKSAQAGLASNGRQRHDRQAEEQEGRDVKVIRPRDALDHCQQHGHNPARQQQADFFFDEGVHGPVGISAGGCWLAKALSLTLTLSRWEREQPLVDFVKSKSRSPESSRGFAETRGMFLPLRSPGGRREGRGEVGTVKRWRFTRRLGAGFTRPKLQRTGALQDASR